MKLHAAQVIAVMLSSFFLGMLAVTGLYKQFEADTSFYRNGYMQGQIDYHNNKIQYSLQPQADGSSAWQKIQPKP